MSICQERIFLFLFLKKVSNMSLMRKMTPDGVGQVYAALTNWQRYKIAAFCNSVSTTYHSSPPRKSSGSTSFPTSSSLTSSTALWCRWTWRFLGTLAGPGQGSSLLTPHSVLSRGGAKVKNAKGSWQNRWGRSKERSRENAKWIFVRFKERVIGASWHPGRECMLSSFLQIGGKKVETLRWTWEVGSRRGRWERSSWRREEWTISQDSPLHQLLKEWKLHQLLNTNKWRLLSV